METDTELYTRNDWNKVLQQIYADSILAHPTYGTLQTFTNNVWEHVNSKTSLELTWFGCKVFKLGGFMQHTCQIYPPDLLSENMTAVQKLACSRIPCLWYRENAHSAKSGYHSKIHFSSQSVSFMYEMQSNYEMFINSYIR